LDRAGAVIHPDFDHVGLFGGKLVYILTRLFLRRYAISRIPHRAAGTGIGHPEAAAGSAKERAGWRIRAQLVGKIAARRAGFENRSYAVIGEAVQNIGEVLARVIN